MKKISAFDSERLIRINILMDGIHDSCNNIYEHLVDGEFDDLIPVLNVLIAELKRLKSSVE
jgi:hypothetical protein